MNQLKRRVYELKELHLRVKQVERERDELARKLLAEGASFVEVAEAMDVPSNVLKGIARAAIK